MADKNKQEVKTTIVTPTTGDYTLRQACISVHNQSRKADHLIVIDGKEYADRTYNILIELSAELGESFQPDVIELPFNTGHDHWLGLKIYSAMCQIVQNPYMAMLDEDNFLEHNWVQVMEDAHKKGDYHYVTCRRKVYGDNGSYLGIDNHESIGRNAYGYLLYDTNTWLMKVEHMRNFIPAIIQKWSGDRALTSLAYDLPHLHIVDYYGTIYVAREDMYEFFRR